MIGIREIAGIRDAGGTRGFVAIELVLAIGLLLVPVVMLVGSLPRWSERQHAAIVAAREAARVAGQVWPADGEVEADRVAREVVATYGIPQADVTITVSPPPGRGQMLRATVTVRMPALAVPFLARVGSWSWTARESLRIDDYRSR
ncbi:MAG: hypothetical protein QOH10_1849 [Actinomycetota bacterium]|jgi:hypothetical protein|nr:hypothetical protein [Actinomycetota bacterium]